ncbi:hypothetical protein [Sorangium sp. So ce233]|uniref:hypothetical protein n=1 Tax=Sorangium sp. So ce233 TaxID=3133290 RepID=UPI003F63FD00
MISVAVRIETECGTCRMPMPVNTLAREVGCQSCGRPTALGAALWQALLRDPVYDGPRMLRNEGRRSLTGKLSAAYTRLGPCCHGCEKEIPAASIQEVREQAMLRCDRCAKQTWVRTVPAEFAGALPNITHIVGEDPDPLTLAPALAAEAATFPCPQCGSPVPFDGVNRACTCRFCNASVHVPDDFVYRGRRKVAARWFLCFHPLVADGAPAAMAVVAGLFDWEEPPDVAVDAADNLYCAARQSHQVTVGYETTKKTDDVIWSVDRSLNIRWLHRNRSKAVRLVLSPKGTLLVTGWGWSSRPWLSVETGAPVGGAPEIDMNLLDCHDMACDHDGSLMILKGDRLRRITPEGAEMPVWPGGAQRGDTHASSPRNFPDCPVEVSTADMRVCCGPDGSIYLMNQHELARFEATGRKIYGVTLFFDPPGSKYRTLGADVHGNAYVLRSRQLVRISSTGEQTVVLESKIGALPEARMSIAVCRDGSIWLFGAKGRAWKFAPGGALLFASEKEFRADRVAANELSQQTRSAPQGLRMGQEQAASDAMSGSYEELFMAERIRERRIKGVAFGLTILFIVVLVAYRAFD